jgi:cell wall-associated NlpC family hydrolase
MGRFVKAALICSLACLALPLGASAERADGGPSPMAARLGDAVLTAIVSATNADDALGALGSGLALMEAGERIDAQTRAKEASAARHDPPGPIVPGDPSTLPPASAGSNGTAIPRHSTAQREKIFANVSASGGGSTSILLTGIALPPPDAPPAVKDVINNANTIVGRPYIWGGGHGSWYSHGYDCSGAVSFALFGGGMIPRPLTSSELEGWGATGPGKWITVYANAGHTFAEIAGLRWDTSGTESGTGPRWHLGSRPTGDFVVRHPPGY